MKQPIPGVAPSDISEATVMETWPSICYFSVGRALGRTFDWKWPDMHILRVGNLMALAAIPVALALYFLRLAPRKALLPIHGVFYRLTNRRIIVLTHEVEWSMPPKLKQVELKSVSLDHFDRVEVERRAGQHWFDAGDLVFYQGPVETFRLNAVSRPHSFQATCQKSQMAFCGVQKALAAAS